MNSFHVSIHVYWHFALGLDLRLLFTKQVVKNPASPLFYSYGPNKKCLHPVRRPREGEGRREEERGQERGGELGSYW